MSKYKYVNIMLWTFHNNLVSKMCPHFAKAEIEAQRG